MSVSINRIINNKKDIVNFVIDILFVFIILQGFGAPGNFSNVIGAASKLWYGMGKTAPFVLMAVLLLVSRCKIMRRDFYVVLFCAYIIFGGLVMSGFSFTAFEQCYKLVLIISSSLLMVRIRDKRSIAILFAIAQIIVTLAILAMIVVHEDSVYVSDGYYAFNLVGLHTTKNTCGYLMVFGSMIFYYLFRTEEKRSQKFFWLILLAIELVLAYLSRTVGAYFGGLIPIAVFEIVIRQEKSISFSKVCLIVNGGFAVIVGLILPSIAFILESMGKSATLTGRTNIWSSILSFVSGIHVLFGYGYGGVWTNESVTKSLYSVYMQKGVGDMVVGGHNLFMELYLNIGVVGITLFLLAIFSLMKPSKIMPAKYLGFEAMLLTFELCRGLVERTLNATAYDTIVIFVASGMIYYTYQTVKPIERKVIENGNLKKA